MQQLTPIEARKRHMKKATWTLSILVVVLVVGIVTILSYI